MSFEVTNTAAYRDAFRKTGEIAAIIEIAPTGRLVDATDRLLSACHLDRASAVGLPLDRLFNPSVAARLIDVSRAAVANSGDDALPSRATPSMRFLDGRICAIPLSSNLAYLRAIERSPLIGSRRDVLLDEMGALSDGMIYIYDVTRQRTCYLNPNASHMFGVPPGRPLRLSRFAPLVHPEDREDFLRVVGGFPKLIERRVSRNVFRARDQSENTWRRIENRYAVLTRDSAGNVQTIIGCAFDITDRNVSSEHPAGANAIFKVEETERRRIARELHDSTAQHLVAADLMVGAHLRKMGNEPDHGLSSARATLSQALREIRTLSFLLHTPHRHAAGFARMLRAFAEGFAERSNLSLTITIESAEQTLAPEVELVLFRICQEAFMNVRRHANASLVTLNLYSLDSDIVLEVEDDGDGIDDSRAIHFGVGLESMRARLQEVGGALTIANTGAGTLIRARAPSNITHLDTMNIDEPITINHD